MAEFFRGDGSRSRESGVTRNSTESWVMAAASILRAPGRPTARDLPGGTMPIRAQAPVTALTSASHQGVSEAPRLSLRRDREGRTVLGVPDQMNLGYGVSRLGPSHATNLLSEPQRPSIGGHRPQPRPAWPVIPWHRARPNFLFAPFASLVPCSYT